MKSEGFSRKLAAKEAVEKPLQKPLLLVPMGDWEDVPRSGDECIVGLSR